MPCGEERSALFGSGSSSATLIAENRRLEAEVERLRGDVERITDGWREANGECIKHWNRADAAEAKLAKFKALADELDAAAQESHDVVTALREVADRDELVDFNRQRASHLSGVSTRIRAVLADAPAECGAEHPTNSSVVPCVRDMGHEGSHMSTTGCGGSVTHWPAVACRVCGQSPALGCGYACERIEQEAASR